MQQAHAYNSVAACLHRFFLSRVSAQQGMVEGIMQHDSTLASHGT